MSHSDARSERDLSAELGYSADTYREGSLAEERGPVAPTSRRASWPAEGLTLVLHGIAGDDLGQWRWDGRSGWWVNELGMSLTLDQVEQEVRTLIRRTPDDA